jgi:hypothetical protein
VFVVQYRPIEVTQSVERWAMGYGLWAMGWLRLLCEPVSGTRMMKALAFSAVIVVLVGYTSGAIYRELLPERPGKCAFSVKFRGGSFCSELRRLGHTGWNCLRNRDFVVLCCPKIFSMYAIWKLLLLFDCKWVVNPVAAVIQYGKTNNIHKQIHITTTNNTYHTKQRNCWVNLLKENTKLLIQ